MKIIRKIATVVLFALVVSTVFSCLSYEEMTIKPDLDSSTEDAGVNLDTDTRQ